jgi:hypothetical protein
MMGLKARRRLRWVPFIPLALSTVMGWDSVLGWLCAIFLLLLLDGDPATTMRGWMRE